MAAVTDLKSAATSLSNPPSIGMLLLIVFEFGILRKVDIGLIPAVEIQDQERSSTRGPTAGIGPPHILSSCQSRC